MCRPPRGRFSHLAMFRIGSLLYIPAYLSVILYRVFASDKDDGNLVLMGGALHQFVPRLRNSDTALQHWPSARKPVTRIHLRLPLTDPRYCSPCASAIRFCGITFSYTAISVLLNYSTYTAPLCTRSPC